MNPIFEIRRVIHEDARAATVAELSTLLIRALANIVSDYCFGVNLIRPGIRFELESEKFMFMVIDEIFDYGKFPYILDYKHAPSYKLETHPQHIHETFGNFEELFNYILTGHDQTFFEKFQKCTMSDPEEAERVLKMFRDELLAQ